MSDTPRTDAEQQKYSLSEPQAYQAWEWARQIERELNAANKRIEELQIENATLNLEVLTLTAQIAKYQWPT